MTGNAQVRQEAKREDNNESRSDNALGAERVNWDDAQLRILNKVLMADGKSIGYRPDLI